MKFNKNIIFTTLTLTALSAGAWAQTETASTAAPPAYAASTPAQPPVTASDIQELKDALAAQQRQIQALQAQLASKEQALQARTDTPSLVAPAPVAQAATGGTSD